MSHRITLPLDGPMEHSSIFYRTHLGHRESATALAIKLVQRGAESDLKSIVDPFLLEMSKVAEPWAIDHLLQGCYVQEYHEWEKGVKAYFKGQRIENNLTDDFDWRTGNKSFIKRTIEALSFFEAEVDASAMADIDKIRKTINEIKHDPLSHRVDHQQYLAAVQAFQAFWDRMMTIETGIDQGQRRKSNV